MAVTVQQFKISSGVCGRFRPQMGPLLRFCKMDLLWPGVMKGVAVTVRQFERFYRVLCRFKPHVKIQATRQAFAAILEDGSVVTWVRQFKIGSGVCSKLKPQVVRLLQFLKMDLSIPGVMQTLAVTVRQFKISSRVFSPVVCVGWKMPVGSVSRGEQLPVQPQLGHQELAQVCSQSLCSWWSFPTHMECGQVTRHPKKWCKDPEICCGWFSTSDLFSYLFDSLPYTIFIHHPNRQNACMKINGITIHRSTFEDYFPFSKCGDMLVHGKR